MRIVLLLLVLLAVAGCEGGSTKSQEVSPPAELESAPADSAVVDTAGVTS